MTPARVARLRRAVANLLLVAGSLTVLALALELVVFRFVLLPSDVPGNVYMDGLVRLEPGAKGVWRVRDEIAAPFAVNAQGWNSGVGDYVRVREPGTRRVVVIGDSYVEALQVATDESLAEQLARSLTRRGAPTESYRLGVSGAPLSQYLRMLERAGVGYRPDVVVVVIVHNDFDQSFRHHPGRYTSSFLKLDLRDGRVHGEIEPEPYRPTWRDVVRQSATARYLYYRQQLTVAGVVDGMRALLAPSADGASDVPPPRAAGHEANIDIDVVLPRLHDIEVAADYLVRRLRDASTAVGARLLLVMDGSREAIYRGPEAGSGALALNRLATRVAERHGVELVDLHPVFEADFRTHRARFDHPHDGHWNARGHRLAAEAVAQALAVPR